jgi:acyl-CoA synthetase (AMP-forming)/AMP-acid ligase II
MLMPLERRSMLTADTLWALLARRIEGSPRRAMLIDAATGRTLTFAEVGAEALKCAAWLHDAGIGQDTIVAWQLPTTINTVITCLALSRLGAVQVPVIHLYRERELREVLRQSRPQFVLVPEAEDGQDYPQRVAAAIDGSETTPRTIVLPRLLPTSRAALYPSVRNDSRVRWYYFTSGTTSRPKAALHTDASLIAAGRGMAGILGMQQEDVGTIGYPFAHVGGVAYTCASLATGMAVVLFERFVPTEVVAAFRRYGVTFGGGSTAHYQALLAEQRRYSDTPIAPTLKVLAGGGASKPAALYYQVKQELGCTVVHAYGLTEAPISTSNAPGDTDEQLAHSDGVPLPGVEVRIQRSDGTAAEVGESGEILLRGPNLCQGYLDPEQTRAAFDANGYFRTGDLGLLRPDGRIAVTGRIKDIIVRKGENISALEIEELLLAHPKVKEVAVIGLPDAERGERVCAVVVPVDLDAPLRFDEMQQFLLGQQLMRQKIPEQLELIDVLPRNEGLQKVVKYRLREMLLNKAEKWTS